MLDMTQRLLQEYFGSDPEKRRRAQERINAGEPLQYVLGETAFYGETYTVTPAVLIPRFDTERVVDKVLKYLPAGGRLLDLCTGSGCIAISSLCHSTGTTAVLLDVSQDALHIAGINAERNKVADRCTFLCADLFTRPDIGGKYDVIASNPPYVASETVDLLPRECQREPRAAFDGGKDGGDFYRLLLSYCPQYLKEGGKLIFEIGYDQKEFIIHACRSRHFAVQVYKDYGGNDRVAVIDPFTPDTE